MKQTPIIKSVAICLFVLAIAGASAQTPQFALLNSFGTSADGSLHPGERSYLTVTNNLQRGMAYNPLTTHLLIASRSPTTAPTINIVDSVTGEDLGTMPFSELVTAGNSGFLLNKIAVAEDGAVYVCNVTSTSTSIIGFVLYRYSSETNADSFQTYVFAGDPGNGLATSAQSNGRWGDTMTVRGSGIDTQILIASQGTLAAILRPADESMTSFTATTLSTDASSGSMADSLSFGAGDTFWAKANGFALRHLAFDLNAGTATTLETYGASVFPSQIGPIFALNSSNLLAGIEIAPGADFVKLYDISTINPPVFLDRQDYYTNLANGLAAGEICYGNGNFYALDSDNGLLALTLAPSNHLVAPSFFIQPVNGGTRSIGSNVTFSALADGIPTNITYQWYFDQTAIADATNTSFSLSNLQITNSGSYSVVAANSVGSTTSSVVTLAVFPESILFIYDSFDYAAGQRLTNFSPGFGLFWTNNGTPADTLVAPTNLTVAGLAQSLGNSITNGGSGGAARLPIGATVAGGALYASFALNIRELGASFVATAPGLIASFFNDGGPTSDQQPRVLVQRTNSNEYLLGIGKVGTGAAANFYPTVYAEGQQHFIVMRYTFVPDSTTNDLADLWIDPDPSTFGLATPPPPTVSAVITNTDVTALNMMAFRQNTTGNTPLVINYDELRIANQWALVTPPAITDLHLSVERVGENVVLSWPISGSSDFILESTTSLETPITWTPVEDSVVIQGARNTVTVAIVGQQSFFRLRK